jgi:hypothetical protein
VRRPWIVVFSALIAVALLAQPAGAITNGQPDGNDHPYVGLIVFDVATPIGPLPSHLCSGALLSPTLVLTAGHCTAGTVAARVWFDEIVQGNPEFPFSGATSFDGIPFTNPDFCIECAQGLPGFALRDVGVVVLTEPASLTEFASLPSSGLVDTLANKTDVSVVGYGAQVKFVGGGPPVLAGLLWRFQAQTELVSGEFTHASEFVKLTQNPSQGSGGTCVGDSGGPDLLGDTSTVLSVNSYITNTNCSGVAYGSRVDIPDVLAWIQSF